jgi:hypothetical protein
MVSQSPGIHRASWRPRGAKWGGWLTVRPGCFNPGKETRYQIRRMLGGPPTVRNNITFFEFRTPHLLPRNESYRLRYPGQHYHCTICNHVLLTKLKHFCILWCWFSLDVFFMDSCFNRVKWETLTYLERYHWNFSCKKWTTYQSYGARPENKNRGC